MGFFAMKGNKTPFFPLLIIFTLFFMGQYFGVNNCYLKEFNTVTSGQMDNCSNGINRQEMALNHRIEINDPLKQKSSTEGSENLWNSIGLKSLLNIFSSRQDSTKENANQSKITEGEKYIRGNLIKKIIKTTAIVTGIYTIYKGIESALVFNASNLMNPGQEQAVGSHVPRILQSDNQNTVHTKWNELIGQPGMSVDKAGYELLCNSLKTTNSKICNSPINLLFSFPVTTAAPTYYWVECPQSCSLYDQNGKPQQTPCLYYDGTNNFNKLPELSSSTDNSCTGMIYQCKNGHYSCNNNFYTCTGDYYFYCVNTCITKGDFTDQKKIPCIRSDTFIKSRRLEEKENPSVSQLSQEMETEPMIKERLLADQNYQYLNQFNNIYGRINKYDDLFADQDPGNDIRGPGMILPENLWGDSVYGKIALHPTTGNFIAIMGPYDDTLNNITTKVYYGREVNEAGQVMSKNLYTWEEIPQFSTAMTILPYSSYNFLYYGKSIKVNCQTQVNQDNFKNISNNDIFTQSCAVVPEESQLKFDTNILPEGAFFINAHSIFQGIINNIAYSVIQSNDNGRNNRNSYINKVSYRHSTITVDNLNSLLLYDKGNGIVQWEIPVNTIKWQNLMDQTTLDYKSAVDFFSYDMTHGAHLGTAFANYKKYLLINNRYDKNKVNAIKDQKITGSYYGFAMQDNTKDIFSFLCWTDGAQIVYDGEPYSDSKNTYCPLYKDKEINDVTWNKRVDSNRIFSITMKNTEHIFIKESTANSMKVSATPLVLKNGCWKITLDMGSYSYKDVDCPAYVSDYYQMSSGLSPGKNIKIADMITRVPGAEPWDATLWSGVINGKVIVYAFNYEGKDLYRINNVFPNSKLVTMTPFYQYNVQNDWNQPYNINSKLEDKNAAYALIYPFYPEQISENFNNTNSTQWNSMIFDITDGVKMGCKNQNQAVNCQPTNGYGLPKNSNVVNIMDPKVYDHNYQVIQENLWKKVIIYNINKSPNNCTLSTLNKNQDDIYFHCIKEDGTPFFAINGAEDRQYYYVNNGTSTSNPSFAYKLIDGKDMNYLPARGYSFSATDGRNYPGTAANLTFTSLVNNKIYSGVYVELKHKNRQIFRINNQDNLRTKIIYPEGEEAAYVETYVPYGKIADSSTGEISICQINDIGALNCIAVDSDSLMALFPYSKNKMTFFTALPPKTVGNLTAEEFLQLQLSKPIAEREKTAIALENTGLYTAYRVASYIDNLNFLCNLLISPKLDGLNDGATVSDNASGVPVGSYCTHEEDKMIQFVQLVAKTPRELPSNSSEFRDIFFHLCYLQEYVTQDDKKQFTCNFRTPTNKEINCIFDDSTTVECINKSNNARISTSDIQILNNPDLIALLNTQENIKLIRLNPVENFMILLDHLTTQKMSYSKKIPLSPYIKYGKWSGFSAATSAGAIVAISLLNLGCVAIKKQSGKKQRACANKEGIILDSVDWVVYITPMILDIVAFANISSSNIFTQEDINQFNPNLYHPLFYGSIAKCILYTTTVIPGFFSVIQNFIAISCLEKAKSLICSKELRMFQGDIFLPVYLPFLAVLGLLNSYLYHYYSKNSYFIYQSQ